MSDIAPANEPGTGINPDPVHDTPRPPGALGLFLVFNQIALCGFGGTLPWAYRILVERRKLLTQKEFTETLALGQILPGPNLMNLGAMVGHRFAGYPGTLAALFGLMTLPFGIIIAIGMAYREFGGLAVVQKALGGMSAVAFGLIIGTGLKLAFGLPRHWRAISLVLTGFVGIGLMRWPLLHVLAIAGPLGVWLAWRERR